MGKDEELSIAIAHAREVGQDAIAEEIYLEAVAQPERILSQNGDRIDPGYVALVKARADIKLKLLAKWNPKRYGDRVQVAGDPNAPLKTEISFDTFATVIETLEARRQDKANG